MNQFWLRNPLEHNLLEAGEVLEELLSTLALFLHSSLGICLRPLLGTGHKPT